ncbi:MAG: hypothetical protein IPM03_00950 [Sulfuritalea sp.]|nr:hypothetical protein [Sulfuritalea sp.]
MRMTFMGNARHISVIAPCYCGGLRDAKGGGHPSLLVSSEQGCALLSPFTSLRRVPTAPGGIRLRLATENL